MKQSIIQHNIKPYYEFKLLKKHFKEFNKPTNNLQREEQLSTDTHLWLAEGDERRDLTDKEILILRLCI